MPTIRTQGDVLVKAIGAGAVVALVVAVLWRFIPDWSFYLSLAMGFGVVEMMAYLSRNKRGRDLMVGAMLIITAGFILSRALLAQRYGIPLDAINQLSGPAVRLLQLEAVPDLVYMALAYLIAWVRFR